MAKNGKMTGSDAAYIRPKLVPDYELLPRDDSGGPEYDPYTAAFGDGGFVQGAKAHLSASGGSDDAMLSDEESDKPRLRNKNPATDAPAKSKRMARE